MRVLGIETSCDETAAAVVEKDADGSGRILSNVVYSQISEHAEFGGVVPEIAARAHLSILDTLIEKALDDAGATLDTVDAIAVTAGPGLVGGLITGMMTAKSLAAASGKPYFAINHLEGHALTPRLTEGVDYPYLLLLVSGGHSQFVEVAGLAKYTRLATTIDDALGEAFDKTAKLLSLGYPGGPQVELQARNGNPERFEFPRPLTSRGEVNFSFSGLKTAVRQAAKKLEPLTDQDVADICASFQAAIVDVLADRTRKMIALFEERNPSARGHLVLAGGVAANMAIRSRLEEIVGEAVWKLDAPPLALCTDNAAMIAWAGLERLDGGFPPSGFDVAPRPRWPLDEISRSIVGSGRRGPKA